MLLSMDVTPSQLSWKWMVGQRRQSEPRQEVSPVRGGEGVCPGVLAVGESWSRSRYVSKVELTKCAGGLDEGSEGKEKGREGGHCSAWSRWWVGLLPMAMGCAGGGVGVRSSNGSSVGPG